MNILENNLPVQKIVVNVSANFGGAKRLPTVQRQQWIEQVDNLLESIPDGYTVKLFTANNARQDAQIVIERTKHTEEPAADMPVVIYQKNDRTDWDRAISRLFLTKEELSNG